MPSEEDNAIERLLDKEASSSQQSSSLKWFAEYLEEGYILNLPPSKALMTALESFSKRSSVDAALRRHAKNLIKKYR